MRSERGTCFLWLKRESRDFFFLLVLCGDDNNSWGSFGRDCTRGEGFFALRLELLHVYAGEMRLEN